MGIDRIGAVDGRGKLQGEIAVPNDLNVRGGALSADGRSFALDLQDGTIAVYEVLTGKLRCRLGKAKEWPNSQSKLWGSSAYGRVREGKPLIPPLYSSALAFASDGRTLAYLEMDGRVTLWDVPEGKALGRIVAHQGAISAVAFSPDGKVLATVGMDTTTLLWDVAGLSATPGGGER